MTTALILIGQPTTVDPLVAAHMQEEKMPRQDHTHAIVAFVSTPPLLGVSGPGSRAVYHSHADGRTPHGHEPTDHYAATDSRPTDDARGYSPGYGIRTRGRPTR